MIFHKFKEKRLLKKQKKAIEKANVIKVKFTVGVRNAFIDVFKYIKTNIKKIIPWASLYFILSLISLFITDTSKVILNEFPLILCNLLPRFVLLFLITAPSFLTKHVKSIFSLTTALYFIWLGLSVSLGITYFISIIIICFISYGSFLLIEIKKKDSINTYYKENEPFRKSMWRLLYWMYLFVILTLIVEIIHRFSFINVFRNFYNNPDIFALNFIVLTILGSFIFFTKIKNFLFVIYSAVWIIFSYSSQMKYNLVNQPLLLLDIYQVKEGVTAALNFLLWWQYLLMAVGIVLFVFIARFVKKHEKKTTFSYKKFVCIVMLWVLTYLMIFGISFLKYTVPVVDTKYVKNVFFKNGFAYSSLYYTVNSFVTKPDGYTEITVDLIKDNIDALYTGNNSSDTPKPANIIVVQVESFCDPYIFEGAQYEYDPMPFIRSLIENYSSGKVDVPVFGGQTVKSEFEFLTGLNINNLPSGYSPYVQYLDNNSVDNFAKYMNSLGYTPTAIHNYQGEFFSRYKVYNNLGFDRFISYEFMPGAGKRSEGIWSTDSSIIDQLAMTLDSTPGNDFVFTVTVQLHGRYHPQDEALDVMDLSGFATEDLERKVAYYINQMVEENKAIESLINYLDSRDEPTYVLFYADHLPTICYNVLPDTDKFTTQYFSWNNMGIEKEEDQHLELYQLSTYLCNTLGFDGGLINKFHSVYSNKDEYSDYYKILQYSLMYEDLDSQNYINNNYKIGIVPLTITDWSLDDNDKLIITGTGFTEDTYLSINDKTYETTYIDKNTLTIEDYDLEIEDDDIVQMVIKGEKYGNILAESVDYNLVSGIINVK